MVAEISRRKWIRTGLGLGASVLVEEAIGGAEASSARTEPEKGDGVDVLRVSVVQFRSTADLADNVKRHCEHIRDCARAGSRVVVFPECSVTGFVTESITRVSREEVDRAEAAIASAAKEANTYAVVGSPTKTGAATYNSAVVIAPDGKILERYHKVHLAGEPWAAAGDHLSVFPVDGTLCSIIICHDERYPELVRLPVIAGARIVFYISHESDLTAEEKMAPYRAQIVARAVENSVYIAHANAPADVEALSRGSHGQSRLIAPDGNIMVEASIFREEVISATCVLRKVTGSLANQSLSCPFLEGWWRQGAEKVKRIGSR
jgi:predicted amidohydrolase